MKFKDLLQLNKENMLPDAERVHKQVMNRRTRTLKMVISCASAAMVLLVATLTVWLVFFNGAIDDDTPVVVRGTVNIIDTVTPSKESALGVDVNSVLTIETSESVPINEMKARLAISPETAFTVSELDDCKYQVSFDKGLQADTLYNVSAMYNGTVVYRWAFQTQNTFSVTNSYPGNDHMVPTNNAIEITFSHREITNFEESFSISPAVEGTFKQYGRTWAFIPSKPLANETHYTVTVKASVGGPGGAELAEDYQFTFRTDNGENYAYLVTKENEFVDTYLTDENPIAVVAYNGIDASNAKVRVFSLENSENYINAYKNYVRNRMVTNAISAMAENPILEFETVPTIVSDYMYHANAAFINYPQPLAEGYYFAEIEMDGKTVYQLLESTNVSVYTMTTNGDYVVWANDAKNGGPLSGVQVRLEGFAAAKTDANGVAKFFNAEKSVDQRFLIVENGDYPYVVVLNGEAVNDELEMQGKYYSYITTNSMLYRGGDKVGIFGAVLPRMAGVKAPETVTLSCDLFEKDIVVNVDANGTFETEVVLPSTAEESGYITLNVDGIWLDGAAFSVADYQLPEYLVTVSSDKAAYYNGENIKITAQVTYIDGTPASGVAVEGSYDFEGVTDENGCVTKTIVANASDYGYSSESRPECHWFECNVSTGTDTYIGGNTRYLVFSSEHMLKATYADGELNLGAYALELSEIYGVSRDELGSAVYNFDFFKGVGADVTVSAELHEVTYTKEISGTSYDPINKTVDYTYTYTANDAILRFFDITCEDGHGSVAIGERSNENTIYYVVLSLRDSSGTTNIRINLYDYDYNDHYFNGSYLLSADKEICDIGDKVGLTVHRGGETAAVDKGTMLCTVVSAGVLDVQYGGVVDRSMIFKKEYAPDVCIYGAYFDGKHIYVLGHEFLSYDYERAVLDIEMTADREEYRPGDTVVLDFRVTDADGAPVKTALNVSVLDRALYLMDPGADEPIYALLDSQSFMSWVYVTTSHRDFGEYELAGGEGGGGGGVNVRSDFEDMPCFETVETDANGLATVSFKLPDTLTEWKVVARAVSADAQAGAKVFDVVSTQEFFVNAVLGETLKTTDDCTVAVKGDGNAVVSDTSFDVEVILNDASGAVVATKTISAEKAVYSYLNFGKLPAGSYTVVLNGTYGEMSDSVLHSFTVKESVASVWITNQTELKGTLNLNLEPTKGGVTVTFVDEELAFWQNAMNRLMSSSGMRADQVLGQYLAEQFFETGKWMDASVDYSVLRDHMSYDGILLTPTSPEADLILSAKLAAAAPQFCPKEHLANGFYYHLENRDSARVDVATAYFGLAAIGEPILIDLRAFYNSATDFTTEETAYLALAFAYAGDFDTAYTIYDNKIKSILVTEGDLVYAAIDGEADEALTGSCSLLSNRLNLEYNEGLIRYIIEHDNEVTLLNLELISYLNDKMTETIGENKVSVTVDGAKQEYSFFKLQPLVLRYSAEQAKSLSIQKIEGNSWVSYSYYGSASTLGAADGESLISYTTKPEYLACGDEAVLEFTVEVPSDYESPSLNVTLPAGLRLVQCEVNTEDYVYFGNDRYNTGSISMWLPKETCTVSILVRGALPGKYVVEPIIVADASNGQYMMTPNAMIEVVE